MIEFEIIYMMMVPIMFRGCVILTGMYLVYAGILSFRHFVRNGAFIAMQNGNNIRISMFSLFNETKVFNITRLATTAEPLAIICNVIQLIIASALIALSWPISTIAVSLYIAAIIARAKYVRKERFKDALSGQGEYADGN